MRSLTPTRFLAVLGALPRWPYRADWSYGPSGLLGLAVLLLIVFALLNHTPAVAPV
ncbi:MAG: DUF3309 family protein [Hyphomicrobium sp.]|uniref:DUF3309 family protein n=1 Tax=Hyphomicrobium sp. TaxID=82 RepID=UPI0039E21ED9